MSPQIIINNSHKTALLIGASGLVGGFCLSQLLESPHYDKVKIFVRKSVQHYHIKLEQYVIDFDNLLNYKHLLVGDDLFCCLGTTMKIAGSKEAYFKVDYSYTLNVAKIAVTNGTKQVMLVSSVGADSSSIFFYNKVKGHLEDELRKLPFWAVHIFQPSVLLGERTNSRWGEQLAGKIIQKIDGFTGDLMSKYRPVEAESVAKAMINAAQGLQAGVAIYPSNWLQKMSNTI